MDYKSGIISMIEKIEKPGTLEYLYTFIYLFIYSQKDGANAMDYRKEIIERLTKIQSEKILRYIYLFLVDIPERYWRQSNGL